MEGSSDVQFLHEFLHQDKTHHDTKSTLLSPLLPHVIELACVHSCSSSRLRALKGDSNLTLSRPKAEFSICTAKNTPNNQNMQQASSSHTDQEHGPSGCYDTDLERKDYCQLSTLTIPYVVHSCRR